MTKLGEWYRSGVIPHSQENKEAHTLAGAGLYCDEHRCCETHSLRTLDSLGPIWEQRHRHYSGQLRMPYTCFG